MTSKRPIKLGVTGGIGSGKSIICSVLEVMGTPVYYADDRAKWLMNNQSNLKENIILLFGPSSYAENTLDRAYIASQIFNDPTLLKKMNELVHPAVKEDFEEWANNQNSDLVAKEAALLYEAGSYRELDQTWLVTCPTDIKIERIKQRDPNRSEEEIKSIMNKQWSDDQKLPLADYVLTNDDMNLLIPQILKGLETVQN